MIIEIQNPELEARIKAQAQARGVSVEAFIAAMIEKMNGVYGAVAEDDDSRIAAMRESVNDELFMADLKETAEDFKYADAE